MNVIISRSLHDREVEFLRAAGRQPSVSVQPATGENLRKWGAGMMTLLVNWPRAALSLALFICSATSIDADTLKLDGQTMGSYYAIVIDGASEAEGPAIQEKIEAILKDVNRQMSTWDSESEISKFNQSPVTEWFPVSPGFAEVVKESIRLHKLTDGAFDPTVAPLIDLWGFGAKKPKAFPTESEIDEARKRTGMQFIEVKLAPSSIRRTREGITLTMSAIAPGHASDRIAKLLNSLGFPSHSVDIGGEIRTGTAKAGGGKWRLGIESPFGEIQRVIECTDRSIATSGNYRNFFEYKGVRYSHTIDPATGKPVPNPPASVSILCDTAMTADGLATSLMVMGIEKGIPFAKKYGLSVLYLDVAGDDIVENATGEFLTSDSPASQLDSNNEEIGHRIPFVVTLAILLLAVTVMAVGVLAKNREAKPF